MILNKDKRSLRITNRGGSEAPLKEVGAKRGILCLPSQVFSWPDTKREEIVVKTDDQSTIEATPFVISRFVDRSPVMEMVWRELRALHSSLRGNPVVR